MRGRYLRMLALSEHFITACCCLLQLAMLHTATLSPLVAEGCNLHQQSGKDNQVICRECDTSTIFTDMKTNSEALLFSTPMY